MSLKKDVRTTEKSPNKDKLENVTEEKKKKKKKVQENKQKKGSSGKSPITKKKISNSQRKKYFPLLQLLSSSTDPQRDAVMRIIPEAGMNVMCECLYNGLHEQNRGSEVRKIRKAKSALFNRDIYAPRAVQI
jgi:hypothetical protein